MLGQEGEEGKAAPQLLAGRAPRGEALVFGSWQQLGLVSELECLCWDGQAALQRGEGGRERDFSHLFLLLPAALLAHAALPVAFQASGCLQDGSSKGGPMQQPLKPAVSALPGIRWLFQVFLERQLNRASGYRESPFL